GRSTNWYESSAATTRSTTRTTRSGAPDRCVDDSVTNAAIGQCHRYSEYERRPIATSAEIENSRLNDPPGVPTSARTTRQHANANTRKPPRYSHHESESPRRMTRTMNTSAITA